MAAETLVLACWTRPSVLPKDRLERERKALRRRLRDWLPAADEAQCPHLALDGLWPRHEALLDTLEAVLAETGIVAGRLDEQDALRTVRRMVNGAGSTAPGWRPVTVANDAAARLTEPPEAGAFPPPLGTQLLVREPERVGAGIRIADRLYGVLDMCLGPRHARPFSELMAGLAAAGLPCRFSLLIEGGGLHRLDAAVARVASSFLAFSSADSLLCRNALRDLAAMSADAQAIVRLRLGLLTWVAQDEGGTALAARLGRLQQVAEGWGEAAFTPLTGDPLESFCASVPGFCCGGNCGARARAARGRPAPLSGQPARHAGLAFRHGAFVPLPGRQAPAARGAGRRRLRLRADLRPAGTGQVGADERVGSRLRPPGRAGKAAPLGRHRHRPVLVRAGLAGAGSPAARAPPRGRLVPAADERGTRHQPLRYPARLPAPRFRPNAPS